MAQFFLGFVIGVIVTNFFILVVLWKCREWGEQSKVEEQAELERLVRENQARHRIIGKY